MAKYTERELEEMVDSGDATTFEKKIRCYVVEEDGKMDVIYVADDGTTLSKHLTLKDKDGVVYALPTESNFSAWWKRVVRVASGLSGILSSPLAAFVGGVTGWPVPKLRARLAGFEELDPADLADAIRDHIGSHKGGRLVLALEQAIENGLADETEAEWIGKLLAGND